MGDRSSYPELSSSSSKPLIPINTFRVSSPMRENHALNKDFCEVLRTGKLEDVEKMIESCGAQPEVQHLTISFYVLNNWIEKY